MQLRSEKNEIKPTCRIQYTLFHYVKLYPVWVIFNYLYKSPLFLLNIIIIIIIIIIIKLYWCAVQRKNWTGVGQNIKNEDAQSRDEI